MRPYGWRPDLPDHRDYQYAQVHRPVRITIPSKVSYRDKIPHIFDQGDEGSCTANSLGSAVMFLHPRLVPSRQFIYYGEREIEGTIGQDAGAEIRDGVKVLNKLGAPPESEWAYTKAHFAKKPTARVYADALKHRISSYSRLSSGNDYRNCLASGFPFVIGFTVYESFESDAVAKTGLVPLPKRNEQVLGGHAVCVIGYDMNYQGRGPYYEVRNSWGADWGDDGNFWMPTTYFENPNLADDAWTLRA